MYQLLDLLF